MRSTAIQNPLSLGLINIGTIVQISIRDWSAVIFLYQSLSHIEYVCYVKQQKINLFYLYLESWLIQNSFKTYFKKKKLFPECSTLQSVIVILWFYLLYSKIDCSLAQFQNQDTEWHYNPRKWLMLVIYGHNLPFLLYPLICSPSM